jgi:AraC-like DNA-binding protein
MLDWGARASCRQLKSVVLQLARQYYWLSWGCRVHSWAGANESGQLEKAIARFFKTWSRSFDRDAITPGLWGARSVVRKDSRMRTSVFGAATERGDGAPPKGSAFTGEILTVRRLAEMPGIEAQLITGTTRLWTVYHTSYDFCCLARARATVKWSLHDGEDHVMGKHSVALLRPGDVHVTHRITVPADMLVVLIDPATLGTSFPEFADLPRLQQGPRQIEHAILRRQLLGIWRQVDYTGDALKLEAALNEMLWTAYGGCLTLPDLSSDRTASIAETAMDYLRGHYADRITLASCAAAVGTSMYHLHRAFKRTYGLPMHQCLMRIRVSHARDMLRAGAAASDVAALVGFADQAHLTRAFRAHVGLSPAAYRGRPARQS